MMRRQATLWFLLALAAVALYLSYVIAKPFLSAIFAAVVLAIVFYPLHTRMQDAVRRRNPAAVLSTILVLVIVAIPTAALTVAVTRELSGMYKSLGSKSAAEGGLTPYMMRLLDAPLRVIGRYVDLSQLDLRATLLGWVEQASKYLLSTSAQAVSNIFSFALDLVVAFFTLFFLFRDGYSIQQRVAWALPLEPEQSKKLLCGIHDTILANVYGGIAVAIVQGSLTGVAFWVLGLSSPIVWGLVASMASLVPVVGTAMVWIPGALLLFAGGHWIKALILLGWGAAVVAQVDALVRPYVVSGRVKVHTLLVFFALLGGVKAFGFMGLFIGPVILSVTIAVLGMLAEMRERYAGEQPQQQNSSVPAP
ncbi:MAG: AI-2E family transporter [Terriglobales bacterium]